MAREQKRTKTPGVYSYKLGDGSVRYGATVWIRGPWGERKQVRCEKFPRERDAKQWRAEQLANSAAGLATTGGDLKFGKWVEQYLSLHKGTWVHGTYRNTKNALALFGALNGMPLGKIGPADIQVVLVGLQGRYAERTIRGARGLLGACLGQAVAYGLIARNPVKHTKAPAVSKSSGDDWTAEQVERLLAAVVDDAGLHAFCRVLAECWLRVGEACALTWADVDLSRQVLQVRRTVREGPGGAYLGETPKTDQSRRSLPFGSELARLLRDRQDRDRLACGKGWVASRCVFGRDGAFLNTTKARRMLAAACEMAGLPVINPHALRHAGASIAIRAGMDPKLVQERLGHTSVQFTYDRYVSANEADHRAAAELFADLLKGAV